MAQRFYDPRPRELDANGNPLSGGRLYFYVPGTNFATPKDTYSDNALSVANPNPVVLSQGGMVPNIFLDGGYDVILQAAPAQDGTEGVQIWAAENVNAVSEGPFALWSSILIYDEGGQNIVTGDDGNYYVSLRPENLNNNPVTSAAWWERVQFLGTWNANITYAANDIAELNGIIYRSAQGSNTNHDPSTDTAGTWWLLQASSTNQQLFTASGTWTKPRNATVVMVELWGAGGGGGGGLRNAAGNQRYGGGGGGGGAYKCEIYPASTFGATISVTVGAGGTAGTGSASDGVEGSDGGNGGNTSFGSFLTAYGGGGGSRGTSSTGTAGARGSLLTAAALNTTGAPTMPNGCIAADGGAGSNSSGTAGSSAAQGGAGGGGGGGLNTSNTESTGGAGGSAVGTTGNGGAGGAVTGGAGGAGTNFQGGGGGGSRAGGAGGVGGAGFLAGGGGGGGASSGASAGNGGVGGGGYARITSW